MASDLLIEGMFKAARERYRSPNLEARNGDEEVLIAIAWVGQEIKETAKQREKLIASLDRILTMLCEDRKARRVSPAAVGSAVAAVMIGAGAVLRVFGYL